ncbi:reverse transcriptase [Elizabethkingia argentiflava]|uniref:Reverse transcriptase n=1 Tax=Elizabethkingia argenteiflava TaxID=2681556 RepID=A0A845PUK8_9FLAO|nr:RNA-directed DNA polymerase [Elizabethkingia argenteiflava]NAW50701.1 reverse transcriptase [Elizabethkingia argenteiflava]
MERILKLDHTDARSYFLKQESYFNSDLPTYFVFENLLRVVAAEIGEKDLNEFYSKRPIGEGKTKTNFPSQFEDVNHKFLNNKDGKFTWRPLQLIHPALYVSLVNKITQKENWKTIVSRFAVFQENKMIRCYSIPLRSENQQSDRATSISQWWQSIEQQSLELALKYEYVLMTDISDCYGSIYSHSVPWAIHTKKEAKEKRNNKTLIGNVIDKHLQDMAYGQTNGIPQGSVLMDFIAEMVLGYADVELSKEIKNLKLTDYEIIRYRDDYRIFSNNPQIAEKITKLLTEVLVKLGMGLNAKKTIMSNNIINNSIKPDKLYWISSRKSATGIQEHLLIIHKLSEEYPNSGSLSKALGKFYNRMKGINETHQNIVVLVSILTDIMYKSPRTYPIASAILSKLLSLIQNDKKKNKILNLIYKKFEKIPNTGHLKIWLQRVTIKLDPNRKYTEKLCEKVVNKNPNLQIWNSDWLKTNLKKIIETTPIIDHSVINDIDEVIAKEEVELFKQEYNDLEEKSE